MIDAVKAGDRAAALARIQRPGAVNARETDGTSALHWAARSNDLELTQALLRAGADAKAANRYGVTPLSLAVINGNYALDGSDLTLCLNESGEDPRFPAAFKTEKGSPFVVFTCRWWGPGP